MNFSSFKFFGSKANTFFGRNFNKSTFKFNDLAVSMVTTAFKKTKPKNGVIDSEINLVRILEYIII